MGQTGIKGDHIEGNQCEILAKLGIIHELDEFDIYGIGYWPKMIKK